MRGFVCRGCKNHFLRDGLCTTCTTCAAQKLYDSTVESQGAEIERLRGHVALVAERARQLADERDYAWGEVEKQRAEIEALHEALRRGAKELFVVERRTTGPDTPVSFIVEGKP